MFKDITHKTSIGLEAQIEQFMYITFMADSVWNNYNLSLFVMWQLCQQKKHK
jgi:hypothetical protein